MFLFLSSLIFHLIHFALSYTIILCIPLLSPFPVALSPCTYIAHSLQSFFFVGSRWLQYCLLHSRLILSYLCHLHPILSHPFPPHSFTYTHLFTPFYFFHTIHLFFSQFLLTLFFYIPPFFLFVTYPSLTFGFDLFLFCFVFVLFISPRTFNHYVPLFSSLLFSHTSSRI